VDGAASVEELPDEPGADVAGSSGDAHPAAHLSQLFLVASVPRTLRQYAVAIYTCAVNHTQQIDLLGHGFARKYYTVDFYRSAYMWALSSTSENFNLDI
jgi:hypothetical protein